MCTTRDKKEFIFFNCNRTVEELRKIQRVNERNLSDVFKHTKHLEKKR
jgi:hypothetical protein